MCLMCNPADIANFVTAGNAVFTISSRPTGVRFTFKARKFKDGKREGKNTFIYVLTGPDNTTHYHYLGMLDSANNFETTPKSKIATTAKSFQAMKWLADKVLVEKRDPSNAAMEFRHSGKCGRCGRALTVPGSLDNGIGPECARIIGI